MKITFYPNGGLSIKQNLEEEYVYGAGGNWFSEGKQKFKSVDLSRNDNEYYMYQHSNPNLQFKEGYNKVSKKEFLTYINE